MQNKAGAGTQHPMHFSCAPARSAEGYDGAPREPAQLAGAARMVCALQRREPRIHARAACRGRASACAARRCDRARDDRQGVRRARRVRRVARRGDRARDHNRARRAAARDACLRRRRAEQAAREARVVTHQAGLADARAPNKLLAKLASSRTKPPLPTRVRVLVVRTAADVAALLERTPAHKLPGLGARARALATLPDDLGTTSAPPSAASL